jgi:hypothetical protein
MAEVEDVAQWKSICLACAKVLGPRLETKKTKTKKEENITEKYTHTHTIVLCKDQ